jgi:ethanolamine utilization protein EutA (predicted chaperonin)
VLPVSDDPAHVDADTIAQAVRRQLSILDNPEDEVVLAVDWSGAPAYPRLLALARGIAAATAERTARGRVLYVAFEADIARTVGHLLTDELGVTAEMAIIDGLRLGDLDHVDLGAVREPSGTIPVVVKSLVFGARPAQPEH